MRLSSELLDTMSLSCELPAKCRHSTSNWASTASFQSPAHSLFTDHKIFDSQKAQEIFQVSKKFRPALERTELLGPRYSSGHPPSHSIHERILTSTFVRTLTPQCASPSSSTHLQLRTSTPHGHKLSVSHCTVCTLYMAGSMHSL